MMSYDRCHVMVQGTRVSITTYHLISRVHESAKPSHDDLFLEIHQGQGQSGRAPPLCHRYEKASSVYARLRKYLFLESIPQRQHNYFVMEGEPLPPHEIAHILGTYF